MRHFTLRAQVFMIVAMFAVGAFSATVYIARTTSSARESIVRLNRDRLSSLTEDLSRRYGSVINFIATEQFSDTTLSQRDDLMTLLHNITRDELAKAPDAEAGFFHSLWNREVGFIGRPSGLSEDSTVHPVSYARLLSALQQTTIEEQREQWSYHESEGGNYLVITKPVFARNRLIGVAWSYDNLDDELAASWTRDVTPFLQVVLLLGIGLATFFVIALKREVNSIQAGLDRRTTLERRFSPLSWWSILEVESGQPTGPK